MTPAPARLSLSQQFLLVSFPILLATTLVIGWWVGKQVEESVVHRIGGDTSLYVDGFIAPHLERIHPADGIGDEHRRALEVLMTDAEWARRILSLRIWRTDGVVLFSSDGQGVGQKLAIDEGLETAAAGNIYSEISERSSAMRAEHGQPMARVIETYTPIHTADRGRISAVAEFYQLPDEVDREAGVAQRRSWLVVAGAMLATYLLLFILVRRGSQTIVAQRGELADKVALLTDLDHQNRQLHARVSRAAAQAISLNEALLQRVSTGVHDGPCQDLGFALMQLKNLRDGGDPAHAALADDIDRVSGAVQSAMRDLRAISADLELPDIERLGLDEIAARVVRDFLAKTRQDVTLVTDVAPDLWVHFRIKTTLYRLLQESLANTFRHAQGSACRVEVAADAAAVRVVVTDTGPGFDVASALAKGRLGLSGMRQRVESLGGVFEVISGIGQGTVIRVSLPLKGGGASA
ncbi:MAG: ATP-binding protein [Burkholderiaceae bacterium]